MACYIFKFYPSRLHHNLSEKNKINCFLLLVPWFFSTEKSRFGSTLLYDFYRSFETKIISLTQEYRRTMYNKEIEYTRRQNYY